ncbi:hypothetical protein GGI14_005997, partial [Coemansia sp. S680]
MGGPYLEIDVHKVNRSTGKVETQTYYSQQCLGATDRLTGCHARYFAASASPKSMDKLAFLIKNMWAASGNGSADDVHERLFLNVLHAKFDKSSKFNGSFVQLISAGPVYINRGDTAVADLTTTAFVGLPSMTQDAAKDSDNAQGSSNSCVHQHSHTVAKWTENMIFKAESESQVVVVVANTMAALNAVYVKCNIPHGNISDCAILLQQTVDGIKGVLAEFDYACYACYADDNSGVDKVPELMLF